MKKFWPALPFESKPLRLRGVEGRGKLAGQRIQLGQESGNHLVANLDGPAKLCLPGSMR